MYQFKKKTNKKPNQPNQKTTQNTGSITTKQKLSEMQMETSKAMPQWNPIQVSGVYTHFLYTIRQTGSQMRESTTHPFFNC